MLGYMLCPPEVRGAEVVKFCKPAELFALSAACKQVIPVARLMAYKLGVRAGSYVQRQHVLNKGMVHCQLQPFVLHQARGREWPCLMEFSFCHLDVGEFANAAYEDELAEMWGVGEPTDIDETMLLLYGHIDFWAEFGALNPGLASGNVYQFLRQHSKKIVFYSTRYHMSDNGQEVWEEPLANSIVISLAIGFTCFSIYVPEAFVSPHGVAL